MQTTEAPSTAPPIPTTINTPEDALKLLKEVVPEDPSQKIKDDFVNAALEAGVAKEENGKAVFNEFSKSKGEAARQLDAAFLYSAAEQSPGAKAAIKNYYKYRTESENTAPAQEQAFLKKLLLARAFPGPQGSFTDLDKYLNELFGEASEITIEEKPLMPEMRVAIAEYLIDRVAPDDVKEYVYYLDMDQDEKIKSIADIFRRDDIRPHGKTPVLHLKVKKHGDSKVSEYPIVVIDISDGPHFRGQISRVDESGCYGLISINHANAQSDDDTLLGSVANVVHEIGHGVHLATSDFQSREQEHRSNASKQKKQVEKDVREKKLTPVDEFKKIMRGIDEELAKKIEQDKDEIKTERVVGEMAAIAAKSQFMKDFADMQTKPEPHDSIKRMANFLAKDHDMFQSPTPDGQITEHVIANIINSAILESCGREELERITLKLSFAEQKQLFQEAILMIEQRLKKSFDPLWGLARELATSPKVVTDINK